MAKAIPIEEVTRVEIRHSWRDKGRAIILAILILFLGISWLPVGLPELIFLSIICIITVSPFFIRWYVADDKGIRNCNKWQREFNIPWDEIERIDIKGDVPNPLSYLIVMRNGSVKLRIYRNMSGVQEFKILVRRYLPWEKWAMAFGEESPTVAESE
jgi:hypothetical protein